MHPPEMNLFAPPRVDVDAASAPRGAREAWAEGKILVTLRNGATLPQRCVKCNTECSEPGKQKRFYWHTPALYLLIVVYVFIYILVALIVRKKATLIFSLCKNCKNRRRNRILLWTVPFLLAIAGIALVPNEWMPIAVGLTFLVGLVGFSRSAQILAVRKMDATTARFSGANPAFLRTLPQGYSTD